jgi:hypothetical protein
MAYYPAAQSRMYSSAKDSFPARRNPLWMSAQDCNSSTDIGIYDGRSGPSTLSHDSRLQNCFQKNDSGAAHHMYQLPLNHLEQNPLYRSPMSEVSANPSRASRSTRESLLTHSRTSVPAPSGSSQPYRIDEVGIQNMVDYRAMQMLQVAFDLIFVTCFSWNYIDFWTMHFAPPHVTALLIDILDDLLQEVADQIFARCCSIVTSDSPTHSSALCEDAPLLIYFTD